MLKIKIVEYNSIMNRESSFTLIELLIVVGILAVIATVAVAILNPSELIKQSRDSQRMIDLNNINKAVAVYQTSGQTNIGSANTVYISIPKNVAADCSDLGLPTLPGGYSYGCVASSTLQKIDGSGWIPLTFNAVSYGTPLEKIPVDPLNTTSTNNYYTYTPATNWELTAVFESQKYTPKAASDGGSKSTYYEAGTNLSLTPVFSLASGSMTQDNARLSMANGSAFVDFNTAGTLTPYLGDKLTITDSSSKNLVGYIKAAGAGETYSAELVDAWTNTGFETFTSSGPLITRAANTASDGSIYKSYTPVNGALFKCTNTVSVASGSAPLFGFTQAVTPSSLRQASLPLSATSYRTFEGGVAHYIVFSTGPFPGGSDTTDFSVSVFSFKKVLTPSATGVTIVSTSGGSTYNWASEDSGFNRNDTSGYTYKIEP